MSTNAKKTTSDVSHDAAEGKDQATNPVGMDRLQAELSNGQAADASNDGGTTKDFLTINFDHPIVMTHGTKVPAITLRRPKGGDLRGVKLGLLGEMDVGQFMILVPRIASPAITPAHLDSLEAPDLVKVFNELMRFFQPAGSPTT